MSVLQRIQTAAKKWLADVQWFSRLVMRRPLYAYQLEPARAIVDSVLNQRGLEFAVMFPRQSGKNETQAQVEAYLLNLFQRVPGAEIVKAQPTYKPQAINARMRLERALENDWNAAQWRSREGYMIVLGQALVKFFSAEPSANAVGASATLLLECDEAQDVLEAEWDKKFVPMGASTNATIVYWGTAWSSRTLLARTVRRLREQERADGIRRVFVVSPEQVARDNPAYGAFVARQVARKGRQHPLVKTQYFNEEIDAEGGMFPPARRALMQGTHTRLEGPAGSRTLVVGGQTSEAGGQTLEPGFRHLASNIYALLLDVAGEDEGALGERVDVGALENPRRDATVLTVVEVDLSTLEDPVIGAPTYRAVDRRVWVGTRHVALYGEIVALARHWQARYLVADATGVGAGLVSFLSNALPAGVVIPFEFNSASKSQLGWDFLAICDTGRWKEWEHEKNVTGNWVIGNSETEVGAGQPANRQLPNYQLPNYQSTFFNELAHCQYEVIPGPAHLLRWGVPDGTRDAATAELVHDDTIMSAALSAVLDSVGRDGRTRWHIDTGPTHIIRGRDPMEEMSRGNW